MFSRERYLLVKAVMCGAPVMLAREAVATTALAHPEWNMDEQRTWRQWEQDLNLEKES